MAWEPLAVARWHPVRTFGATGGVFALLFILTESVQNLLAGRGFSLPSGFLWLFVVGGVLGGALLAWLLWERLGAERSPRRGAAVGALVGFLALPVPFYILELALVVAQGIPFEPQPGVSPLVQLLTDFVLLPLVPLFLGALGLLPTYGGTVVIGALVGYLLARE
ncbi:hypothetical protein [Halalkalicoccus subterraneus]|uniref:hypothetical protein n=1 Tax=Halalkalicoccus subterraneus TaxID=2675002 RepID=UPI000EFA73B8|nr:hypothetical protein [Halalkalicoccus subterraneus]